MWKKFHELFPSVAYENVYMLDVNDVMYGTRREMNNFFVFDFELGTYGTGIPYAMTGFNTVSLCLDSRYSVWTKWSWAGLKNFEYAASGSAVRFRNDDIQTLKAFKELMKGVFIMYEIQH